MVGGGNDLGAFAKVTDFKRKQSGKDSLASGKLLRRL